MNEWIAHMNEWYWVWYRIKYKWISWFEHVYIEMNVECIRVQFELNNIWKLRMWYAFRMKRQRFPHIARKSQSIRIYSNKVYSIDMIAEFICSHQHELLFVLKKNDELFNDHMGKNEWKKYSSILKTTQWNENSSHSRSHQRSFEMQALKSVNDTVVNSDTTAVVMLENFIQMLVKRMFFFLLVNNVEVNLRTERCWTS